MRDGHGAVRNQPHAEAREALFPAAARPHAAGAVSRLEPPAGLPLRRGAGHEPVELPADAGAGPRRGRHRRGQHRGAQAERLRAQDVRGAGKARRPRAAGGVDVRRHRRARGKRDAAGLQVRLHLLHRRRQRRPAGHGEGRRAPGARDAGAGRQEPVHRRPHGQPRAGREAHRLRQIPELRPDLRRAGLHLLRRSHPRTAGRGAQARRRRARSKIRITAASSTASTSTG